VKRNWTSKRILLIFACPKWILKMTGQTSNCVFAVLCCCFLLRNNFFFGGVIVPGWWCRFLNNLSEHPRILTMLGHHRYLWNIEVLLMFTAAKTAFCFSECLGGISLWEMAFIPGLAYRMAWEELNIMTTEHRRTCRFESKPLHIISCKTCRWHRLSGMFNFVAFACFVLQNYASYLETAL